MPRRMFSHWRIGSQVVLGGMAVVYHPEAVRLGGQVAVNTRSVTRRVRPLLAVLSLLVPLITACAPQERSVDEIGRQMQKSDPKIRQALFDLVRPVTLTNCTLARYGEADDGGYLMCANLLADAGAAYSYGISGYDKWGCDISTQLGLTVHQYDCFNTTRPACPKGKTVFHAECVAEITKSEQGRPFDTMQHQFERNGDGERRLLVKMDVEGAEWDSLLHASDETLDRIDQLAIELHYLNEEKFVRVLERLRRFFHVAYLHFNNYSCIKGIEPFPAWAYEVLFVSKRIGVVDPSGKPPGIHPAAAPNSPMDPDCQLQTP